MPNEANLQLPSVAARTLYNLHSNVVVKRNIAADAAANTTTAETLIGRVPCSGSVTGVKVTGGAAVTASDTLYATITVYARDTNGTNQVTLATQTTKVTGGSGNWTAFKPVDCGTITNAAVLTGWVLSYAVAKASTGTQLPDMELEVVIASI